LIIAAATIRSSENEREARGDTGACICWEGYRLYSLSSMRVFAAIDQHVHETVRSNFSEDFFQHLSCRIRRLAHTNESRSTCCTSRFVIGTDIGWCFCGRIFLTIRCEPGGFTGGWNTRDVEEEGAYCPPFRTCKAEENYSAPAESEVIGQVVGVCY
jgi:hypothetical protein